MYYKYKIQPFIKIKGSIVVNINFRPKIENKEISIMIKKFNDNDNIYDEPKTIESLKALQELNNDIAKKVLNYKYKSFYNDNMFLFLHKFRPKPLVARYKNINLNDEIDQIDICKAYSHMFEQIKYVPIFTTFNYPKTYDNHIINNYYIYLIEIDQNENNKLFFEKFTLIYGYNLLKIKNKLKYKIIDYLEYTYLEEIKSKKIIDQIFKMENTEYVQEIEKIESCFICCGNCTCKKYVSKIIKEDPINLQNRKFTINNVIGLLGKYRDIK